jgi:hypothetical protein
MHILQKADAINREDVCELTFRSVRFLSFAGVPVADSRAQLSLADIIVPEVALQGDLPGAIHAC